LVEAVVGTVVMVEGEAVDVGVDEEAGEADMVEVGGVDMVVEVAGTVAVAGGNLTRCAAELFLDPPTTFNL
jgi:hypothetical protein